MAVRRQPSKRGMILLGYLPATKLACFSNPTTRQTKLWELFHFCMSLILEPIRSAGRDGVLMTCADGKVRRVHPILAAYMADYPEQCLIGCCPQNSCPICLIDPKDRGDPLPDDPGIMRDPKTILAALRSQAAKKRPARGKPSEHERLHLRAVEEPFWADLPYANIFGCFTPDILHQLHKGVFKDHLVNWCIAMASAAEIDNRFKCMPSHPTLRHFKKGISTISQWTGREHKEMEKVFATLIYGAVKPEVSAVARAIIDFIYYASFETHTTTTLNRLQEALDTFHEFKDIFVQEGIREHFRIPKIHSMEHYTAFIRSKGSCPNFNTELSERLHINYAKQGYQASNRRDYMEQMVVFLTRREKILRFKSYLLWTKVINNEDEKLAIAAEDVAVGQTGDDSDDEAEDDAEAEEARAGRMQSGLRSPWQVAKTIPFPNTTIPTLVEKYGAVDFLHCLEDFVDIHLPHSIITPTAGDRLRVYKRATIELSSLRAYGASEKKIRDVIRAQPSYRTVRTGKERPGHFDVVLVRNELNGPDIGLESESLELLPPFAFFTNFCSYQDYRAARVRVIFRLDDYYNYPETLVYVEWFTKFNLPLNDVRACKISYSMQRELHRAEIIPLSHVARSCTLTPLFGKEYDETWTAENVLDRCKNFLFNSMLSIPMYEVCDADYVADASGEG